MLKILRFLMFDYILFVIQYLDMQFDMFSCGLCINYCLISPVNSKLYLFIIELYFCYG